MTVSFAGSSAAWGRTVLAPPGDSAVSQYAEVVPTDRGPGMPGQPGRPGHSGGPLSPAQLRTYDGLGPEGRVLVGLVDATSPSTASGAGAGASATGSGAARGVSGSASAGGAASRDTSGAGLGAAAATSALSYRALSAAHVPSVGHLVLDAATGGGSGGLGFLLPVLLGGSALCLAGIAVGRRMTHPS